jgi:hypothetical protein
VHVKFKIVLNWLSLCFMVGLWAQGLHFQHCLATNVILGQGAKKKFWSNYVHNCRKLRVRFPTCYCIWFEWRTEEDNIFFALWILLISWMELVSLLGFVPDLGWTRNSDTARPSYIDITPAQWSPHPGMPKRPTEHRQFSKICPILHDQLRPDH